MSRARGGLRAHALRLTTAAVTLAMLAVVSVHPVDADDVASPGPASPEPMRPRAGLQAEPVAEGVWRVVADEAGHRFTGGRVREVAVGPQGAVWVAQGRRIVGLGRPGAVEPRTTGWQGLPRRLAVDKDGALWAQEDGGAVVREADGAWVLEDRGSPSVRASLSVSDGVVSRLVSAAEQRPHQGALALREATGWRLIDVPDGVIAQSGPVVYGLARGADDRLWLAVDHGPGRGWLGSYGDDTGWVAATADDPRFGRVRASAAGDTGPLWFLAEQRSASLEAGAYEQVLAVLDDEGWHVFGPGSGMPQERDTIATAWSPRVTPPLAIDGRGAAWFSLPREGLFRFDGSRFEQVDVPGLRLGALDLDVDADGDVWVATMHGELFVVDGTRWTVSAED